MLTSMVRPLVAARYKIIERNSVDPEETQRKVLKRLVGKASGTVWGKDYNYGGIKSYEDYIREVPVTDYPLLSPYVERIMKGEKNILWPGSLNKIIVTSGTTGEFCKYLPLSDDAMRDTHIKGPVDSAVFYLHNHPESRVLDRKSLILGGNYYDIPEYPAIKAGTISSHMLGSGTKLRDIISTPPKDIALIPDFQKKLETMSKMIVKEDISSLSGTTSWMLMLMKMVKEETGAETLFDIWPNMEVFFHGGLPMDPYRSAYEELFPSDAMSYCNIYNASEGFFAIQDDPADTAMRLMLDYGVFYEFKPVTDDGSDAPLIPVWEVEKGARYHMFVTTSSGLWRYPIGDVVRFTSVAPYRLVIDYRDTGVIDMAGERFTESYAQTALTVACGQTGARVLDYTVAPLCVDLNDNAHLQWLIEFEKAPEDLSRFEELLDEAVINTSHHYKEFRNGRLGSLQVIPARPDLFNDWLKSKGKFGGQNKVPRVRNSRDIFDEICAMNR